MPSLPAGEIEVFGLRGVLQSHRGGMPPQPVENYGYRRDDNGLVVVDEVRVYALLGQRLQAKAARDYAAADRAREELRAMGVDVFDSSRIWRVRGGTRELNATLSHLAQSRQLSACRAAFAAGTAAPCAASSRRSST